MATHDEFKKRMLADPEVQAEYDRLTPEFTLLDELLRARQEAGLSQAEIARRMGTKPPAVSRLLSCVASEKHSPSIATLRKYAAACGLRLEIHLVK
ncbi:MAG: helix-turn-helix transcriptional regulator [Candidatus Latescibacterota bacterium]